MHMLHSAIEDLARGNIASLDSIFHEVKTHVSIDGTVATCHFHCVHLDGNGRPRIDGLIKLLINNVVDYAIPRKRIKEAARYFEDTGSTEKHAALVMEAKGLFTRLAKSGEGGELILFLMAERFLKLPQLLCKMNLKTSTQMHYHGADGLHVGVDAKKQKLCLYWGESKLYGSLTSAVNKCMKSISPLLLGAGGQGGPEERDLQLLGQFLDVQDVNLEAALKNFLDPESPNFNSVEYRGLCLVGFDSGHYPDKPNKIEIAQVNAAISCELEKWSALVGTQIQTENIESFSIHVFLVPFPSVKDFRAAFKAALS